MESTETEKTEEGWFDFYESYTDLFEFFCDNTTIHGTIRLNCSRRNKMKTGFWVVLYISAFGMMYLQFGDYFTQYWAYPTNLGINLQTTENTFPAVTVCNMNPYRFDQVNEYLKQLDQMAKETLTNLYGYNASLAGNNTEDVVDLKDITNVTSDVNRSFQLDRSITLMELNADPNPLGNKTGRKLGFKLCNSSGSDCYYRSFWSGVDGLHEWYKFHFMNIMSKIPPVLLISDRVFMEEFILTCDFNGEFCDRNYTYFHHPTYGTCFTLNGNHNNNTLWKAVKPGKQYGLSITVKVDQNDNMPILSTAAGAKVMIHNPDQSPLVDHQGFDIWPGTETSISVRQDQMNRLEKPYSDCTSDGSNLEFTFLYNSSYTFQACIQSCFQYVMIEQCGCGYYFYPLPLGKDYCDYNKYPGWGHCFYRLYEKLFDHKLCFSKCPKQCTETMYYLSAGSSKWPTTVSKKWVLPVLSSLYGYNTTSSRSDVSKINVYFQELNFQGFEEAPAINIHDLLSTMGNQWAFWFGSSVLSVAEIAELVFDVFAMLIIINFARYINKKAPNHDEGPYVIGVNGISDHHEQTIANNEESPNATTKDERSDQYERTLPNYNDGPYVSRPEGMPVFYEKTLPSSLVYVTHLPSYTEDSSESAPTQI
ncbi:amiloride-sensitive sodium channel subunit delta [Hyperolius riggenbachi]|uniref:amiloride-sensitive sodium channel subunit delta n=1 Tax=Hyperolius riggenbachi TaxID=752182 RepID=UPI0035A3B08D